MINDWLLGIGVLLLGVGIEVFCFALTWGQAPFVRASRPPTPLRGLGGRVFMAMVYLYI